MAEDTIIVTQKRSTIRRNKKQLATLQALGLGRIGKKAEHPRRPEIMGMLESVAHLVEVEVERPAK